MSQTKNAWPELVGQSGEKARESILADDPAARVEVVPASGGVVPPDLALVRVPSRVRIYTDDAGLVVEAPRRG